MTEDFLGQPESVYGAAIHAGGFGSDTYLHDRQMFVDRVLGAWNTQINNYYSCPTEAHENAAEALHELYVMYREFMSICPSSKKGAFSRMFVALAKGDLDAAFGEFGKAKWPIVRMLAEERERRRGLTTTSCS
tara:strand:- start:2038 stop:2436 length:399 start_codon:yes stop_codon:yes gene_type:complete